MFESKKLMVPSSFPMNGHVGAYILPLDCSLNKYSNLTLNLLNDTLEFGVNITNDTFTDGSDVLVSLYGPNYPGSKPIPSLDPSKPRSPSEEYFL
jgi:hypothetical protein